MTRNELYAHIKGLGLQEEIKARTGKNFTVVSNAELEIIVKDALKSTEQCGKPAKTKKAKPKEEDCCVECDGHIVNHVVASVRLIEVLHKKKILLDSEIRYILQY